MTLPGELCDLVVDVDVIARPLRLSPRANPVAEGLVPDRVVVVEQAQISLVEARCREHSSGGEGADQILSS